MMLIEHDQIDIGSEARILSLQKQSDEPSCPYQLILIHGIADSHDVWREAVNKLPMKFDAYYEMDLPWNLEVGDELVYEPSADVVLAEAWKHLPKGPKVVLAHSFGANVLLSLGEAIKPEDIHALVLLSVYSRQDYKIFDWPFFTGMVQEFDKFLMMSIDARLGGKSMKPRSRELVLNKAKQLYSPSSWLEFYKFYSQTPGLDVSPFSMPTLIAGGAQDFSIPHEEISQFSTKFKRGQFEFIAHCGHFAMVEDSDFVSKLITSFIEKELTMSTVTKPTKSTIFPRNEGNNICTWIGFKHVMYVAEEAILDHFRQNEFVPRALYEDNGLCLEIVDSDARILHALHMDDVVEADVQIDEERDQDESISLIVNLNVERDGQMLKAVVCRAAVLFKLDDSPVTQDVAPIKVPALEKWTYETISRPAIESAQRADILESRGEVNGSDSVVAAIKANSEKSLVWKWHIPYFYCHFNERMKHSGYLRLMEEVEDLFLADNGISIRTMLHEKKWIPVVPSAQVEILEEAFMEETLYTTYTLVDTYRDFTYTHRMDCYVERNGKLIHTATGSITHGYARINDRKDWSLVAFDDETKASIHKNLVG
ncbi:alpha/beta fold hydrolase [Pseudoalteromonas sp. OOF1S-7]|uniref:alpha/beta fold hydrolase n=1 Tax=Pseudoalteromonas sp. OOF1S-7 TaxID=2917757 RepID=UPI001EF71FC1|nr:alpha/beta fold hydrolase [Pseudoalteromonas sp. OOF1S-7]MCG7536690.1 alpha/beta fold hydrolase [Pseudoalteromonas sp. OOF1S-7]